MISNALRQELQSIGEANRYLSGGLLSGKDRDVWRLLMCGDEPWQELAESIDEVDLRNVIRGLVLFSQASGWSGGSVSPVILLYRSYIARFPDTEPELTSWVVDNRRNEYEPFGTIKHGGARSRDELREYDDWCATERAAGLARDAERQREAARAKAARATTRVAGAVRRGDVAALRALMAVRADLKTALPAGESLMELAKSNGRDRMVAFLEEAGVE